MYEFASDLAIGQRFERYRRTWRVARSTSAGNKRHLLGRIGFVTNDTSEMYDEQSHEFRDIATPTGASSFFLVNRETGRLAFQIRPGIYDRRVYAAALQGLANSTAGYDRWSVKPDLVPLEWEEWLEQVHRVNVLRLRLERPNPNYRGRPLVEPLLEETHAEVAQLVLTARDDGSGINVDDALVAQALDHVRRGYGKVVAEGDGRVRRFDSTKREAPAEIRVPLPQGAKDVSTDVLVEAASSPPTAGVA